MTTQPVTMVYDRPQVIELPELILRQLTELADATHQSVETMKQVFSPQRNGKN